MNFSINFRFSGTTFTVSVLFVGFSILNKADVVSPGLNLPPNQLVWGIFYNEILGDDMPIEV